MPQRDRLGILQVGARRLALPLSHVSYFTRASEQQAVRDGPLWMAGVLRERGSGAWLPIVDLARLWDDGTLQASWAQLVATRAAVAVGIAAYATTREEVRILPLRPAPGNPALGYAAVIDGEPIAVLDVFRLVTPEQWQALAPTA